MAQITLNSSGVASSGSLLLQTNGTTTQATVDTSGNLGLGVTPSAWAAGNKVLSVGSYASLMSNASNGNYQLVNNAYNNGTNNIYVNSNYATLYQSYQGQHQWYNAPSGTAGNAITFTQAMTLDASGYLQVGTTSAIQSGSVTFAGSSASINQLVLADTVAYNASPTIQQNFAGKYNSGGSYASFAFLRGIKENSTDGDTKGALLLATNNGSSVAERARIDSSGNLLVGTTSATGRIAIQQTDAGNPGLRIYASSSTFGDNVVTATADRNTTSNSFYFYSAYNNTAGAYKFRVADSGNVTNTNNSYGAISDIKLKENITDATPKLAQLKQVRVVNYNFIGSDEKQLGVIAQEIEQVFPRIVDESIDRDEEGNDLGTTTKSVKYSVFVPMLIKAIQELDAKFEAYKAAHP